MELKTVDLIRLHFGRKIEKLNNQKHVETFSFSTRRIARRLAQFVGALNQVSTDNVKS